MKHTSIALTGASYSGKSTLAYELTMNYGFMTINFGAALRTLAAIALSAAGSPTTVPQIEARKEEYRPFLQELGIHIKFDRDPQHIYNALLPWLRLDRPPVVFDCVRSDEQAEYLGAIGFQIVEIQATESVRRERAKVLGHMFNPAAQAHKVEQPLSQKIERAFVLDGSQSPAALAALVCRG